MIVIRENINAYMSDLREWLKEVSSAPIEQMADFFASRIDGYEEHMTRFFPAYDMLADAIPKDAKRILDIGCGTGLELERIFKRLPEVEVTGVDLSSEMLIKLRNKFPDKSIKLVCADYFVEKFPGEYFDVVISFETLHHFTAEKKLHLYKNLYSSLKKGGTYIECDYIACCEEEERILSEECMRKRKAAAIADDVFIHFDTPFTAEHELSILREAGFINAGLSDCVCGVAMLSAVK